MLVSEFASGLRERLNLPTLKPEAPSKNNSIREWTQE
jgi:hypothetical protein